MNSGSVVAPMLLVLAGCASAPRVEHPAPPVTPPSSWTGLDGSASPAPGSEAPWWSDLDDPNLGALLAEGLEHNHDLAAAAARVDLAAAQARIAGAPRWPQVAADGDATRSRRNFVGFPDFGGGGGGVAATTSSAFGVNLSASWEVDLWGRLRGGQAAAMADVEASQFDLSGARLSLESQIIRAYAAAAEADRQVRLAEATSLNRQQVSDRIERRYVRGLRSSLDVRLARSDAAGALALLAMRRLQLDAGTRQLELLLGRYPSSELAVAEAPLSVIGAVPAGLPADLIRRRPDLAAAERRLAASDLRVSVARRALLPGIRLTASGGRSSAELGDLLDGDFSVWNLVGNLTLPLFQGGRLRANVDAAEAGRNALVAAYASRVLTAFAEVEAALRAEELLAVQEQALMEAAHQAGAAQALASDRYDRGLGDSITLLAAQRRAYDAQSQLLSIQRQRVQTRVDLHVALGGGFTQPEIGRPTDG